MHPSTEDLLSVRDGEPLDAVTSNVIADDPAHGREIERLSEMRNALKDLPELAPPDGMWERIVAVERATRGSSNVWSKRVAGLGVAAAVAALAVVLIATPSRPRGGLEPAAVPEVANDLLTDAGAEAPSSITGTMRVFDPDRPFVGARVVPTSYPALVQESARLDRALRRVSSYQRPVMSGETASTIAGLESRIELIDEQLTYSNAHGAPQPQRTALWGERVELMNALVHVRYAQATGF